MVNEQLMTETDVQNLVPRGPGEVLKVARNRMGLSLEQVAQYLHLPIEVVDALESDHQEKLPEPAYVKGYIRSYGRYLELEVEPLIESYVKYVQPPDSCGISHKSTATNGSTGTLGWITLGSATLLIAFVSAWWITDLGRLKETRDDSKLVSSEAGAVMIETNPSALRIDEHSELEGNASAATSIGMKTDSVESALPGIASSFNGALQNGMMNASPKVPIGENLEVRKVSSSTSETEIKSLTEALPNQQSSLATQQQTGIGDDSIQLTFDDHSWAEVYDANEKRLLFGLMKSGSVEHLQGSAPFTVLLGNSPTVKIQFNGELFDHSSFDRWDKTAHFKVGNSAAN